MTERNQKMAQRLQKQIQRSTRAIRLAVSVYNKENFRGTVGDIPDQLMYSDMLDPHAPVYHHLYGIQLEVKVMLSFFCNIDIQ